MSEDACLSPAKIFNETPFLRTTVYPNGRVPYEINTTGRQMLTPKHNNATNCFPVAGPN